MSVQILRNVAAMRTARAGISSHKTIGLVPTMGALHDGHCSLLRAAREQCDIVIASIFVNPMQFGPNEDFSRYPRTFDNDLLVLEDQEVDLLFAPSSKVMYPEAASQIAIDVGELGTRLDGKSRPGHFRGVATVVAKLFHLVQPDIAFFGQKDAAQVAVIRAMVRQLDFPVRIEACPTVRDADGLALSSRNRYLTTSQRKQALALYRALELTKQRAGDGMTSAWELRHELCEALRSAPGVELEYAEVVDEDTLLPVDDVTEGALIAIAAKVGDTRLIDNIVLAPQEAGVLA